MTILSDLNINKLNNLINGKNILLCGGSGSLGNEMTRIILQQFKPNKLIILSRDEYKQYLMKKKFNDCCMRYFIGDIRDYDRLESAFTDVSVVFSLAALKQIDTIEYNPFEAVKTNINGTQNIIKAAIKCNVKRVIFVSTDKACNPINFYGCTKLCSEKLIVSANNLSGKNGTMFSNVRYGNVICSRGSVVPFFLKQRNTGILTITDKKMTRFTITLKQAVYFILNCLSYMISGETFIPKLPSYTITQLASIIGPECKQKIIGHRKGEKIHESMISIHESPKSFECKDFYVIKPLIPFKNINYEKHYKNHLIKSCENNFNYSSEKNELINDNLLKEMINKYSEEYK